MSIQIDRIGIFILILYNLANTLLYDDVCLQFTIPIN